MRAWERRKIVDLEEIEDTLAIQVGDDADVIPIIETLSQVDAFVAVVPVVLSKCGEYSQFDPRGISVLLHRADNLNGTTGALCAVIRFDDFAECALPK